MLNLAVTALATLTGQSTWPPDMSDLFRATQQRPMIELVMDISCSMGGGALVTPCIAYTNTSYSSTGGFPILDKSQMLEAALTGCRTANDGVLDKWDRRVNFGMRFFEADTFFKQPFQQIPVGAAGDAAHNAFEASALTAHNLGGGTSMTLALGWAGRDFRAQLVDGVPGTTTVDGGSNTGSAQTVNQFKTEVCRKNFILLLSDGEPNSSGVDGTTACDGTFLSNPGAGNPEDMADYLLHEGSPTAGIGDHLCSVTGDQPIGTYTIGFGAPGSFSPSKLQQIASQGGGQYFYAADTDGINKAMEKIILSIIQRSAVFGGGGTVQRQGLFAGGINYLASYRTNDSSWVGNLKKLCVLPPVVVATPVDAKGRANYITSGSVGGVAWNDCMFYARTLLPTEPGYDPLDAAKKVLFPNATPKDQFCTAAGTCTAAQAKSLTADVGGAGSILYNSRIGSSGVPVTAASARHVLTYFPNATTPAYIDIDYASNGSNADVSDDNMWVPDGDTWKIINRLNGYSYDADATTGVPVGLFKWPFGDPVNSNPVLIRYAANCTNQADCVVVVPTNNGLVHFVAGSNGREFAALVPGELWRPGNLSHFALGELERQPTLDVSRRIYLDGPAQLFHDDKDGDGVVDAADGDHAYLVFNLGRGGRVSYAMDVTAQGSIADATLPPVKPLGGSFADAFRELRDTWANPWLGRTLWGGVKHNVAIFSSGHIPEFDRHDKPVPGKTVGNAGAPVVSTVACTDFATEPQNGLPTTACSVGVPAGVGPGIDVTIGPFYRTGVVAYRVHFSFMSIEAGSYLGIGDSDQRWANIVTGAGAAASPLSQPLVGGWSRWVYSKDLSFHVDRQSGDGFAVAIDNIELMTESPGALEEHYPSIFAVDLDNWVASSAFDADVAFSPLARITRRCTGDVTNCIDSTTNGVATADLAHMTCPISTDVTVVNYSDDLRLYWGDECGQIWVANTTDINRAASSWKVRRLAHLSTTAAAAPNMSNQTAAYGLSMNMRKLYRRLDVIASTCPGSRVFAVYFGTGDIQRPLAKADSSLSAVEARYLQDGTITTQRASDITPPVGTGGRDVVGMVFDRDVLGATYTVQGLYNATSDLSVSKAELTGTCPSGSTCQGWYIELASSEKMLRDPLVFQNVFYFKTFRPLQDASECAQATAIDTSYAMNNCTAEPVGNFDGAAGLQLTDRVIGTANEDIGPDPYLLTTTDGAPLIVMNSAANASQQTGMATQQRATTARPRIYNWRLPR